MKNKYIIIFAILMTLCSLVLYLNYFLHKENPYVFQFINQLNDVLFDKEINYNDKNSESLTKDELEELKYGEYSTMNKNRKKIENIRNTIRNFGVIKIKNKEHVIRFLLNYLFISSKKMDQHFLNKYQYNFNHYDLSDCVIKTIWLISPEKTVKILKEWKYLKTKENIYDTYIVWRVIAVFKKLPDSCELNNALENFLENNRKLLRREEILMILEKQYYYKYNNIVKNQTEQFFLLGEYLRKIQDPIFMNTNLMELNSSYLTGVGQLTRKIGDITYKSELLDIENLDNVLNSPYYNYDEKCGFIYFFILDSINYYKENIKNKVFFEKEIFLNLKKIVLSNKNKITTEIYDSTLNSLILMYNNYYTIKN